MDIYVYYRVRDAHAVQLQPLVSALQADLARRFAVQTGLKHRPQNENGMQTWMEIYLDVPDHFDTALERAAVNADLLPLIDGARHIEHFLDFSPCV